MRRIKNKTVHCKCQTHGSADPSQMSDPCVVAPGDPVRPMRRGSQRVNTWLQLYASNLNTEMHLEILNIVLAP